MVNTPSARLLDGTLSLILAAIVAYFYKIIPQQAEQLYGAQYPAPQYPVPHSDEEKAQWVCRKKRHLKLFYGFCFWLMIAIAGIHFYFYLNPPVTKNDEYAYGARAAIKYDRKDYRGALEDYSRDLRLNPESASSYYNRGLAKYMLLDFQGAIRDFTLTIQRNPNHFKAYYSRGLANGELHDYDAAIQNYSETIKRDPQYADAYYHRGKARESMHDIQGALNDYKQALALNPNLPMPSLLEDGGR